MKSFDHGSYNNLDDNIINLNEIFNYFLNILNNIFKI